MAQKILCTFPGRHGDLLWALPTLRAIAEGTGQPVDLLTTEKYGSLAPLIAQQDYIGQALTEPGWVVEEGAPMTPRIPPMMPAGYDQVLHLGYSGWPSQPLPYEIYQTAREQFNDPLPFVLDLQRPWIAKPYSIYPTAVAVGWSEEHFELKVGLTLLLRQQLDVLNPSALTNLSTSPRWQAESYWQYGTGWDTAAAWLYEAKVFVGCCSALHVLAVACGRPAIIVEPNPQRHHKIFWPLGMDGDRVQIVRGNDGLPTFDARHLFEVVKTRLGI